MSQFRQDIVTKQWVLIAPKRALRNQLEAEVKQPKKQPSLSLDPACVFCPGNESLNPDTILALPKEKNWKIRVIPNKYEAVSHSPGPQDKESRSFYSVRPGSGDHEVIVMRDHSAAVAQQPVTDIDLAIQSWLARTHDLQQHSEIKYVHIWQNHKREAGATVSHPHFQVLGLPFIPEHLNEELSGAVAFYREHHKCVYCRMLEYELKEKTRIVYEDKSFVAVSDFAAQVPFHIRIIPRDHQASFSTLSASLRRDLAHALKNTLGLVYDKLSDPAYNLYLHTLPICDPSPLFCDPVSYHWHITIMPRLNIWGGFEFGTQININPVSPEDAAEILRS